MDNFIGRVIDRYHVTELIGKGGMASVYKAFDTRLERYVAIKFIRADAVNKEVFLKRFEREAKALARLSHPNIVKVLDYGSYENIPYIVMEYVPGGTLKQRLGRPMSPAAAARLILPIARTLDYTHRQNIIHRDVKPANFLIMESGEPMLSDFGIARMMEQSDAAPLTSTGAGIGTPEYMSPEQCKGTKIDQRADIYSLGVVLYELITGAKPFTGDTPMAVLIKHCNEPLPSPGLYVPGLPQEMETILKRALAKNPEDRFQSMGQFAAALEKILQDSASTPPPQTIKKPPAGAQPLSQQPSPIPPPRYNYPVEQPSAPKPTPAVQEPPRKNRMIWWLGGGALGLFACAAFAALIFIGGNLFGDQQKTSITATAQSLASTIQANQALRTEEARNQTVTAEARSTAAAISAAQTSQAQDTTATALVEEQNANATSTAIAEQQTATQNALDAIWVDYQQVQQNWFTDYSTDFDLVDEWGTGDYQSEWWVGSKTIANGYFVWDMTALKGFYHYINASDVVYSDFLVTLVCGQTSGHENGEVGLVLRWSDNNDKYYFTIKSYTQRYEFIRYANEEWTTLDTNKSQAILPGELNHIAIKAEDNLFTIFINNEFITQIEDDTISAGTIAFTGGFSNPDESGTFEFDYLTIQAP